MGLRRAVRSRPLFLRIFGTMLLCVAVVQVMNFVILAAAQSPPPKLYTVGQIVDAMQRGDDSTDELKVRRVDTVEESPWNPRAERLQLALAKALEVPVDQVYIHFPPLFYQREITFDRARIPRALSPPSAAAARDVLVIGNFTAALRMANGSWREVAPTSVLEPWRWVAFAWLLLSVAAVAPFAWALARRVAKPFDVFAAAAERLGRDPRAPPLAIQGPPEIAEASAAFNQMQARLNRYVDDRTTIIGAAAHDLRTPLMRLGLRLEQAPEPLRRACEADIRDMQAMISATIGYVRDVGEPATRRPLDLRSLAETVTDDLSDRGAAVTLAPGEPVVVEGNSAALKALVSNLVSNALKYAGNAEVSLSRQPGSATIEVVDNGPGIPDADLDRVFEPFYRGERSRNRDTGGFGLGLASVRAVARAHGGEVRLENRPGGGLSVRVSLPA